MPCSCYELVLLFVAFVSARLQSTVSPLTYEVDFAATSFLVDYTVLNNGEETVEFLPWKTPLDTIWEDLFVIADEAGNEVPYTGKIARRVPVTADSYFSLSPNETARAIVDLTRSYILPEDGVYSVSLRVLDHPDAPVYVNTGASIVMSFQNTVHQMPRWNKEGDLSLTHAAFENSMHESVTLGDTTYTNCNEQQISDIQVAFDEALNIHTKNANVCLASPVAPTALCQGTYKIWYGATTASQYDTVRRCWSNLERDLPLANFYCCPQGCGRNCGPGIFAYVFNDDPDMVQNLCDAFWDDPYERAGTMTHEQSHFLASCGTDDFEYGRPACMQLAQEDVTRAIDNADNYCFFGWDVEWDQ